MALTFLAHSKSIMMEEPYHETINNSHVSNIQIKLDEGYYLNRFLVVQVFVK